MLLTLIISAIALGLFFIALLSTKRHKKKADYLLISWLLILVYQLVAYYSESSRSAYSNVLAELSGTLVFLHGPVLLAYTFTIYEKAPARQKKLIHLIPFLLNLLLIPVLVTQDNYLLDITLFGFKITSMLTYLVISLRKLNHYDKQTKDFYSTTVPNQVLWLKMLILGISGITITGATSLILTELNLIHISLGGELLVPALLSVLIFVLGFYGLRQTNIFIDNVSAKKLNTDKEPAPAEVQATNKYNKTGLKTGESKLKFEQLQEYIKTEKPYLDPELTLPRLASETQITVNQLSQIINQNTGQSFHLFINNFRVSEIMLELQQGKHQTQTLLSIAYSAGFSSKTSFNRMFKQVTGLTPTTYIKQIEKG